MMTKVAFLFYVATDHSSALVKVRERYINTYCAKLVVCLDMVKTGTKSCVATLKEQPPTDVFLTERDYKKAIRAVQVIPCNKFLDVIDSVQP